MKTNALAALCACACASAALTALAARQDMTLQLGGDTGVKNVGAAALPDLASATRVRVAGKVPVVWGATVALVDADARTAQGGVCKVAFEHEIRNTGKAAAAGFSRRWNNQSGAEGLVASVPPLPAGASLRRVDTLALKPGVNQLLLGLDNLNQIQEANKDNNLYALTVVMNGNCSGASAAAKVQAAGIGNSRFAPQQTQQRLVVPAVQQQPGPPTTKLLPRTP